MNGHVCSIYRRQCMHSVSSIVCETMHSILLSCLSALALIPVVKAKYDQYILAPTSRTIFPASVHKINGTVKDAETLCGSSPGNAVFNGISSVAYDYGKNVGGLVTITIGSTSDQEQFIGVAFSESSLWISDLWSDATADAGNDEILWWKITGPGDYTVERKHQRGGFRYMTLVHNTTGSVGVKQVQTYFTALPHLADDELRNYSGWFHSNDELVNRIWYAGAYTAQLCTIDPHYGNSLNFFGTITASESINGSVPWWSNTTIANASSVLVDGAKRDRLVWPGDMVTSWPTMLVSTNDKITVKNSLDSLFERQNKSTGVMPYAGYPFPLIYSATYHLHNLIGAAEIYLYDGDLQWISAKWEQWKFALSYSLSTVDSSGLMNVTSSADWLRFGMGGHNIEANAILYHTLNYGIMLAQALNDNSVLETYMNYSQNIKSAANKLLWDESAGLYKDNETTTLHPQDGNSWAVLSNLTDSTEKSATISAALAARWGPYGAPAPEAGATVSPFVGGFELQAHAVAGNTTALLDLCRLQWGFMLDDPRMTNSTFIEGYSTNGDLHYAPYTNDPRVSHAHGWSTGPTSALTFYVAGVQIVEAAGKTWRIAPRLGGLTEVDAGFATSLGQFSASSRLNKGGCISVEFKTPEGTMGTVSVETSGCSGQFKLKPSSGDGGSSSAKMSKNGDTVEFDNVPGGSWTLTCS
ncbi:uncharacterized protein PV09_04160 [Verruconis gallopava]|uniref:Alpha-L-rhamnosidase six-hairpin glycosidase domain-containing protein n=1 Tax=Verruconis gallopava TaxID=253628 RepID=A0A0D1YWH8_9PEZI|nr:uncharacterized protein PV09_04160 [Verruconis gallopava]KIW05002.1 hypothetical protein PV09_04160 [Verruconis gallopava]